MTDLEVRELELSEYKLWDDLVKESPHGTVFHTSGWLAICRDVLNKNLKIYGCFQNEELVGGCSLFIKKVAGIFKVASSTCEMTPYGGIVIKDSSSTKIRKRSQELHNTINCLRKFLIGQKFDHINMHLSPEFIDIRPFTWNGWDSNVRYAYYAELDRDIDKHISRNMRREIKRTRENKTEIRKMNDPKIYYDLFSMVFRRQNMKPPVPIDFFYRVFELIESDKIGHMASLEMPSKEIVAAQIRLYHGKQIYAWSAASNPKFRSHGYTTLLYYHEFKNLENGNFKYLNLMAANTPQFTDFITGFNPKLVPYYSISFSNERYNILKHIYLDINHIIKPNR